MNHIQVFTESENFISTYGWEILVDSHLEYYLYKLKTLPPNVVIKKAFREVKGKALATLGKISAHAFGTEITDEEFLKAVSNSKHTFRNVEELQKYFRQRKVPKFFIDPAQKDKLVKLLQKNFPETIEKAIKDVDQICDHIFDVLGSGPVNVNRQRSTALNQKSRIQNSRLPTDNYESIDWHVDFKTGYSWNPETYYRDIKIPYGTADIKVPWELSRFQHVPTLGKVYWITEQKSENKSKYAFEFMQQIEDWIEQNPPKFGVNWNCPMDVAIRVVNWLFGFYFFADAEKIPDAFWITFLKSLFLHGRFVRSNLEIGLDSRGKRKTTNHYLSDIAGLIFLGIFFNETKEGKGWLDFGVQELITEMEFQVYPDGVDFESSIPYQRLVLELFASSAILCEINDIELPQKFWGQLEKMFEFVMYYTKPEGTAPQIGDNDDGRLHILANYGNWQKLDHRYLLSVGAILFDRSDFREAAGGMREEAFWLFGEQGLKRFKAVDDKNTPLNSRAFVDGGFYIMRRNNLYMIVSCSPNIPNAPSVHGHNCSLSFELYADDRTFLVDPGSYIYTADPVWRNTFRSTTYHNTVSVDGQEQNRFFLSFQNLFSMQSDAMINVNVWEITREYDFFDAKHSGYERLSEPVTHQRQILFDKKNGYWVVKDILTGKGKHAFDLYFHFAPMKVGLLAVNRDVLSRIREIQNQLIDGEMTIDGSLVVETRNPDETNLLIIPLNTQSLSVDILDGWVSSSYGTKEKASIVKYSKVAQCPTEFLTLLYPAFMTKKN